VTRLRLSPTAPWTSGGYSSAAHTAWLVGEVREVTAEQAAYLLATFPGLFLPEPAPAALPPEKLDALVEQASAAMAAHVAAPKPPKRGR
jgi:hypothetical protein